MARSVYDRDTPRIKPVKYQPIFTTRQMLRLTLMRWLVRTGRINEGERQ